MSAIATTSCRMSIDRISSRSSGSVRLGSRTLLTVIVLEMAMHAPRNSDAGVVQPRSWPTP